MLHTHKTRFNIKHSLALGWSVFATISLGITLMPSFAPDNTSATTDMEAEAAKADYYLNLSSTADAINMTVSPTADGTFASAQDQINVTTNIPSGYKLYLSANSDGAVKNSLYNINTPEDQDPTFITASGGTFTNTAKLSNNTWGYGIPNTTEGLPTPNGFGESYSAPRPDPEALWAGVPAQTDGAIESYAHLIQDIDHDNEATGGTNLDIYYGTRINSTLASGNYTGRVVYTAVANAVPDSTFSGITRMQDMTPEICAAETTPANDATEETYDHLEGDDSKVPTAILTDTRGDGKGGEKSYKVSKLADGSCWMRENLALELNASQTLTNENTDLNSVTSWTPERSTGAAWSNDNYNPYSLIPSGAPAGAGVYYNWTAAVASNDTSSSTTSGTKMPDSICPKGWQLPGDNTSSTETNAFAKLFTAYGWNSSSCMMPAADTLTTPPINFVLAGYVYSGSLHDVGGYGYLWSPVVGGSSYAYGGDFYSDGYADPGYDYARYYGQSVRCVAR